MARTLVNMGEFWLPEKVKNFSQRATLRTLKDGAVLFWAGEDSDHVYFVEEGYVNVCHLTGEGDSLNLLIHGPGEIVGVGGVLNGTKRAVNGIAIGRCRVWEISAETFLQLMHEYPELAVSVATVLSRRMRRLDQQVLRVSSMSVDQRVALALLEAVNQEEAGAAGANPRVRMTHQNISSMVGVCRQTITETLGKFRREGILETRRGQIEITDMEKLQNKAHAGIESAED